MQLCTGEPAGRLVLEQRGGAAICERAKVAVHGQVKSGVVVFYRANKVAYAYVDGKFFFKFAGECLLRGFARLHFAAREFPAVFLFAVAALRGKESGSR